MRLTSLNMMSFNGHLYALIGLDRGRSWQSINSFVQTDFETGTSDWHLATVSDAPENAALADLLSKYRGFDDGAAFGLIQHPEGAEPGGGWGWITGEPLTFTSWFPGEPNNAPLGQTREEDFGQIYFTGLWNDIFDGNVHFLALAELDTSRAVRIDATQGNDKLIGSAFGDVFRGLGGNDILRGGLGDDTLEGGDANDVLVGGKGADDLTGGGGADSFRFTEVQRKSALDVDVVRDFQQGLDVIDLGRIDANAAIDLDQAFVFIGTDAFSGAAGELRAEVTASGKTRIFGDVDGNSRADFVIVLSGAFTLTDDDFIL